MATTTVPAIQIGAEDLKKLMIAFGPEISICVRGRHAVGKSEVTYQFASMVRDDFYKDPKNAELYDWTYEQGLPVIERRLSQLTEGDLTGMPDLNSGRKATVFKPCDWLIEACERPVVLFLDERNRALEGVKQAVFQIMDSKAFYGHKLHPRTRVIVAENVGDMYNVQQCDPAEISRAATVELAPEKEEWINYISQPGKCHELTIAFVTQHKDCIEVDSFVNEGKKVAFDPNAKSPDRRSWFKLDQQLQKSGLIENPHDTMFYVMSASMLGVTTALQFHNFAKNFDMQISLKEILTDWNKAKWKLKSKKGTDHATLAKYMELIKKIETHVRANDITDKEAKQIGEFLKDCPAEARMTLWSAFHTNTKNLVRLHRHIEDVMLNMLTSKEAVQATAAASKK